MKMKTVRTILQITIWILCEIVEGCGGGIGAALMGTDGIPIAQVRAQGGPGGPLAEEIGLR